jgi:hypothetical protein
VLQAPHKCKSGASINPSRSMPGKPL